MIYKKQDVEKILQLLQEKGLKVADAEYYLIQIVPLMNIKEKPKATVKQIRYIYILLKMLSEKTGQDIETIKETVKFVLFPEFENYSFSNLSKIDALKVISWLENMLATAN